MHYWGLTDPGCVRTQNQDIYCIEKLRGGALVCVVCDGMGGAKSGNVASSLAAQVFAEEIKHKYRAKMDRENVEQLMERAVEAANRTVYEQANRMPDYQGMGTTLVAALIRKGEITIINVGDSRVYCVTEEISQITEDHSLVQMMLRRGEITPEQARNFPGRNYITRAVGTESTIDCDFYHLDLKKDDCLLLCTDGLTSMLDEQEILFEVRHGGKMGTCCQRLRDIVIQRGAPDNLTAILVQI